MDPRKVIVLDRHCGLGMTCFVERVSRIETEVHALLPLVNLGPRKYKSLGGLS